MSRFKTRLVRVATAGLAAAAVVLGGLGLPAAFAAEDKPGPEATASTAAPAEPESTEAPAEPTSTEASAEPESIEASAEPASTEAPSGTEATEAPSGTTVTPQAQEVEVQADSDFYDITNDPVFGTAFLYKYVVTSWSATNTGLKDALNKTGTYNAAKPYVILVGASFAMSEAYTITDKNIVLRKATSTTVDQTNHSNEKPWNYAYEYGDTDAASPDQYDGVTDFMIGVDSTARHFTLAGTNAGLVTENVTLQGRNAGVNYPAIGKNSTQGGGVTLNAATNTIAVNIADVGAGSSGKTGAAIQISGSTLKTVNIRGGVLSHNHAGGFGGAAIFCNWTTGAATINITGYTIIENNYSEAEGGAIYWNGHTTAGDTIDFRDHVIMRNNTGGDGGAIHMQGNMTVNLRGNTLIENNRTLNVARTATLFPGNGGGIWVTGYSGTATMVLNVYDEATIRGNQAARGGGGIAVGNSAASGSSTVNLYGGHIVDNAALGTARELSGTLGSEYQLSDVYSIGGGGGIYAYDPKVIKIPADSTVTFSGNTGAFSAFIDNDYFAKDDNQKD
ncbi:MAG: hypothetical protein LBR27_11395, partial [Bifidobacteriaceae bacterium]|nr:hypothetical protein [Bifidobacteriaceae bacterium]